MSRSEPEALARVVAAALDPVDPGANGTTDAGPQCEPPTAPGLEVPDDYILTESRGHKTGLWQAKLTWAPDGPPTHFSVRLAERPNGIIELDRGTRERGSRSSTFTRNRQSAVDIAHLELLALIRARLANRDIDREVEEAGGDLTVEQAKRMTLKAQKPLVGEDHLKQIERVFDIVIALKGSGWSLLLVAEDFPGFYMEQRTTTTITFPDHLGRTNSSLAPCSMYTAAKELRLFAAQVRMLSDLPRAPGSEPRALRRDPFSSHLVKKRMPDPSTLMGPTKRPLHAEHLLHLLGEWTDDLGDVHAAPVDAIDDSGQLRLSVTFLFDQARRRESVTMLRRRNIALTEREVRAMLERINGPVRPEWAPYFVHGLVEWEGEADKQGFHRVYPLSAFMRAELDLYDARAKWTGWEPDQWIFPRPTDSTRPLPWSTLYNTPEPRKAKPGEDCRDEGGKERVAQGGEICYDENGEIRYKRKGGRYQRAVALLHRRLRTEGRNPEAVFPVYRGEVVHGWRDGWAGRTHELGYGRVVEVDARMKLDLDQNADYLGNWAMGGTVKHERYVGLHPIVLMGIVEGRESEEVVKEVARARAEEIRRNLGAIAELRALHH